jgi:hypothetical protein
MSRNAHFIKPPTRHAASVTAMAADPISTSTPVA